MNTNIETKKMNLNDFVAEHSKRTSRKDLNWVEFGSKKKLMESGMLEGEVAELIYSLRQAFSYLLHVDKDFVIITFYSTKSAPTYSYALINLTTQEVYPVAGVKAGKEMVAEMKSQSVTESTEEPAIQKDESEEKVEDANQRVSKKTKSSRRSK